MKPRIPPWGDKAWFIFSRAPRSCDEALLYSTALTCIADKLESLAEAVSPTRWQLVKNLDTDTFPSWSLAGNPWIIPPMAPESRVVLRDLARYAISQLATVETLKLTASDETCIELYAHISVNPSVLNNALSKRVFGTNLGGAAHYPPLSPTIGNVQNPVTVATAPLLARQRLLISGNNLRAASRLLESGIRSAVAEDLASAEHGRAMATDLVRSNETAWGLTADGSVGRRFGTYGHALKVLKGRLEMGPVGSGNEDPACGGVAASDVVSLVSGVASKLRPGFPKIVTPGQQEAVCMVESLGLVVPDAPGMDAKALRNIVRSQAVAHAAAGAGIPADDASAMSAFRQSPRGVSVGASVDSMADGDLRLALMVTAHEYGLLLDRPLEAGKVAECGANGLACASHVADEVADAGGVVLRNGIPKSDLTTHAAARAGAISAASQCAEPAVASADDVLAAARPYALLESNSSLVSWRTKRKLRGSPSNSSS